MPDSIENFACHKAAGLDSIYWPARAGSSTMLQQYAPRNLGGSDAGIVAPKCALCQARCWCTAVISSKTFVLQTVVCACIHGVCMRSVTSSVCQGAIICCICVHVPSSTVLCCMFFCGGAILHLLCWQQQQGLNSWYCIARQLQTNLLDGPLGCSSCILSQACASESDGLSNSLVVAAWSRQISCAVISTTEHELCSVADQ
jgi:hypothetical protein